MHSDKTLIERLSEAMTSDDLTHREKLCDVDFVGGAGMAGIRHGRGSALMDLHLTLAPSALGEALEAARAIIRAEAGRHGWFLTPIKANRIAHEALRHYLNPACSCCHGRGMVGVERAADEKVVACSTCNGVGEVVRRGAKAGAVVMRKEKDGTATPSMRVCPDCNGRKHVAKAAKPEPQRPRPCGTCCGSGRRPLPVKYGREIRTVLYRMEADRRMAGAAVRKVMRIRGDVE